MDRPSQHAQPASCIKDPSLLKEAARSYADLPGGHSEGYDDTFKQVFRRFYHSIEDPTPSREYPQFADGLRQLTILEAETREQSDAAAGWMFPEIAKMRVFQSFGLASAARALASGRPAIDTITRLAALWRGGANSLFEPQAD